ncbi:putative spermidine/putrescine transport system ATP-binding protein/thiamine transport system ATP-binding protein [Alkalispirochaeta americana]|uniref:Putative spermidine/putrescine transport system ATP-binding protein/thiamine transport system ATP-binding protein n=1 Tax=Alkalispirochaeta americana TaxID=159291 RepID=A0A1N6SED4_9SPIO|nr:ABC transporter ATP-binding protein [Alkalispirochaeta americana]SIQ39342.1 putative spermidine/putrescine transport system ATP-binding protein/thiamine transport system ATP-binding protein [Alkalispirochaeta americana]
MIHLSDIVREYPDFRLALDLSVTREELVTLLGHSGSGKTTTLRILAGFEKAHRGSIILNGRDVTNLPPEERGLGYVFQDYTLFPHLDVSQNIAYGLRVQGRPRPEQRHRVEELLELVGLGGFGKRPVHTLSGGEQQRVAVARALAPGPEALLLDEPFSAIDPERRASLRRHLLRVQRELRIPTVFVTHSRTEALYLSDRIFLLRQGILEDQGTPLELYERPRTEYAARFLGAANIIPGMFNAPGSATDKRPHMIRPEHLRLDSRGPLSGRVTEEGYYGSWWEYKVETSLGELTLTTRQNLSRGELIRLDLPREHQIPLEPSPGT